ncbi:Predicted unusual protein kinase regulating ubiquinone biosynthesis, AarF/ABC1/UbiB family [Marinobacter daqiaonensis]|uniref:Predicted unusual protein kinase regulating ubiquinone biosynthesis, AarF/ABC1/UbiB family n=1 Tax=Marinobacter daqiaonensis TaxID=650891 RepID=A0A1I6IFF5_9GAMM|nr:AarF/ABC1/UbiB kinase family protein [Marinobacter daqiaonensis]SFR65369.1 Predicted unusual protein kinase regulating ubiquinone biosynthesis, AarF/ABC1/UbiB family [Marinobacter daqiaonensis]
MVNINQGIQGALRIGQTASVLGRTGIGWLRGHRPPAPRLLRETFESLGATYIKLGQFIASSPTFFPREYVDEFQGCLDRTPSLPFSSVRRIIRQELGRPLEEVYSEINPVALASASIAQVHAARLVTGEDVVIKVQKPNVETVLLTDLNFLYLSSRLIETLAPKLSWTSLSGIVEEIQQTMMEECDFIQEARNLNTFRRFLQNTHNEDVAVPKVYEECSTRRVLTMERFYGVPLTDLETIRRVTNDPEHTLITAMNTWFASLTQCEFFHADVHAGNLMVLDDGRVGFIDFGIVGRIRPETWQAVSDFIGAVMAGNFDGMADAMVRIGITRESVDVPALSRDLSQLYRNMDRMVPDDSALHSHGDETEDEVNNILMEVVRIGEDHGLHFPREFALLLKQFLYFDRYVHILAPEMDVFMDDRLTMLH